MRSLYESILDSDEQVKNRVEASVLKQQLLTACDAEEVSLDVDGDKLFVHIKWKYGQDFELQEFIKGNGIGVMQDLMKNYDVYYILNRSTSYVGNGVDFIVISVGKSNTSDMNNLIKLFDNPKWHWSNEDHKEIKGKIDARFRWGALSENPSGDYKRLSKWMKTNSTHPFVIDVWPENTDSGNIEISNFDGDFNFGGSNDKVTYILKNCKIGTLTIGANYTNCKQGPVISVGSKANKITIKTEEYTLLSHLSSFFQGIEERLYKNVFSEKDANTKRAKWLLENEFEIVKKNIESWGKPDIHIVIPGMKMKHFTLKEWKNKYTLSRL